MYFHDYGSMIQSPTLSWKLNSSASQYLKSGEMLSWLQNCISPGINIDLYFILFYNIKNRCVKNSWAQFINTGISQGLCFCRTLPIDIKNHRAGEFPFFKTLIHFGLRFQQTIPIQKISMVKFVWIVIFTFSYGRMLETSYNLFAWSI